MKKRRSWADKLNDAKPHKVMPAPIDIAGMKAGQIMLVPSAQIVDAFIRRIPRGKSIDVKTLRLKLARNYRAEVTCPITMGFHLRTVTEAAYEALEQGAKLIEITPFWRVLDEHTPTAKKLSFDVTFITHQRKRERIAPCLDVSRPRKR
ncbi:MAG: hypothetical protein HY308_18055 [Gammaproteobacteria bacterium]|nr:hypothetical protein [Gammaproteobacteria bacterium]